MKIVSVCQGYSTKEMKGLYNGKCVVNCADYIGESTTVIMAKSAETWTFTVI